MARILILRETQGGTTIIPLDDQRGFFKANKQGVLPSDPEISEVLDQMDHPNYIPKEGEVFMVLNIDELEPVFEKNKLK